MRYRLLGRTGLRVSEFALGTMTFGGRGHWAPIGKLNAKEAEALIGTALDEGVNLIDTADVYSEGLAETFLGEALSALGRPRDQVLIATKVRGRSGPGVNQVGLSRGHIMDSIDASLARLKLDHIDLYQVHGVDRETPIEETVRALDDIVRSGKARYAGFSNFPAWYAMKAIAYADAHDLARFVSAQMYYSIAARDIEREIVPLALDQGLAILPWSPLAGGLLSGKFDLMGQGPAGARRTTFDFPPVDRERAKPVLAAMRQVADDHGVSVARVALAWLLTRPFVTSVLVGAKTSEQLLDDLAAEDVRLTNEQISRLDAASSLPSEYPGWMVERQHREQRLPEPEKTEIRKAA